MTAGLLGAGGSVQALAEAAGRPEGREAVRAWGDRVADLLDGDRRRTEARTYCRKAADAYTRADAPTEAAHAPEAAARLTSPTDRPTPAAPPARTTDSGRPAPPPPGAPDTAGR